MRRRRRSGLVVIVFGSVRGSSTGLRNIAERMATAETMPPPVNAHQKASLSVHLAASLVTLHVQMLRILQLARSWACRSCYLLQT